MCSRVRRREPLPVFCDARSGTGSGPITLMSTLVSAWPRTRSLTDTGLREFAAEVCADLSKPQKELHSKYLYDELGSALFEAITRLPEYGLTRADERLLCRYAPEMVQFTPRATVIE